MLAPTLPRNMPPLRQVLVMRSPSAASRMQRLQTKGGKEKVTRALRGITVATVINILGTPHGKVASQVMFGTNREAMLGRTGAPAVQGVDTTGRKGDNACNDMLWCDSRWSNGWHCDGNMASTALASFEEVSMKPEIPRSDAEEQK